MTKFTYKALTLILIAAVVASASPYPEDESSLSKSGDLRKILKNVNRRMEIDELSGSIDDEEDMDNKLFPYDPLLVKQFSRRSGADERKQSNVINSNLFSDLERESSNQQVAKEVKKVAPTLPVAASEPKTALTNEDKIKSIAFNSREVRLMGPDQKEVEMKDDIGSQMFVALDNLQKEASEVWDQVSVKLDKGWTDLKKMVETAVAPSLAQKKSSERTLREAPQYLAKSQPSMVVVSPVDGYSMADEEASSAMQTSDSTGTKIKGFLSNIGINEDNQKKASDALSKAGSAVSDTVTKDLPDAFKKAGDAVSDTVTKDIPDAFKNFFG